MYIVCYMELRHLRYFLAVAEELNFTRAAKRLQIAQPPLSQQIIKLERELGVELFERTSRAVRLTPAGTALVTEAQDLLRRATESARTIQQVGHGSRGLLRIGAVPSAFSGILSDVVPEFRRCRPNVYVVPHDMETTDQIEALVNGSIDIGFFRASRTSSHVKIATSVVEQEPLFVALPIGHPALSIEDIDLKTLADERFVLFPRHDSPEAFDAIIAACSAAGFTPHIALEARNDHSLISIVAMGLGVSIVPRSTSMLSLPGVGFRPLSPPAMETPMSVAVPKSHVSPQAELMLDIVHERAMKIGCH